VSTQPRRTTSQGVGAVVKAALILWRQVGCFFCFPGGDTNEGRPMIALDVRGFGKRSIEHVVMSFEGALSSEGKLVPEIAERLMKLSICSRLHIVCSDFSPEVESELRSVDSDILRLAPGAQDAQKVELVRKLGPMKVAAVGCGRSDALMLREATLGIAVIGRNGAHPESMAAAQVVCSGIQDALDLLLKPRNLMAVLAR
jgi:soluble P-type ATPase